MVNTYSINLYKLGGFCPLLLLCKSFKEVILGLSTNYGSGHKTKGVEDLHRCGRIREKNGPVLSVWSKEIF